MVPHPLDQKPPSDPVHVIGGSVTVLQHLPRVGPTAPGTVDPLAKVRNLDGEARVGPRVPGIYQRVCRQLSNLVGDDTDHPVDSDVAVR